MAVLPEPPPALTHRRIQTELERKITSGEWPVGTRLPAEPELALELSVSRGTLRRALATLRARGLIEAAPGRGSHVISASPALQHVRRVAMVVPSVAKPYVGSIVQAVEDELHRHGYSMLFGNSGASREQEAGRVTRMLGDAVAGLIAYPIDYDPDADLYTELRLRGIPLVFVDRYLPSVPADTVIADNTGGAYQAVSHLASLGHRRIGFLSTDNVTTTSVAERLQGYRQAIQAAGLAYDDELVSCRIPVAATGWGASDRQKADTRRLISDFLTAAAPTAVFALHDRLAFDVHKAAAGIGWRVPEDLSVVGFDDDQMAQSLLPGLTTVHQPRDRMGRLAARLLLQRVQGSDEEPIRYSLATTFRERQSTAPPRASVPAVAPA